MVKNVTKLHYSINNLVKFKINHSDITTFKRRIQFDAFIYGWHVILFILSICLQCTQDY